MALILLHVGILITVGPDFFYQILIVEIFIFFSPFQGLKIRNQNRFTVKTSLIRQVFEKACHLLG